MCATTLFYPGVDPRDIRVSLLEAASSLELVLGGDSWYESRKPFRASGSDEGSNPSPSAWLT
jgi:hypothetical protein